VEETLFFKVWGETPLYKQLLGVIGTLSPQKERYVGKPPLGGSSNHEYYGGPQGQLGN